MKTFRFLIPAILSGSLLALAWLGFSGLILLIAFIPLLYAEELISQNEIHKSILFWIISLVTFLIWNALSTWWIWNATPIGALFAIMVNSLLMSLVWWSFHLVKLKNGKIVGQFFLFFAWISFEYLHYKWDMSWPWLTLGNGLANDVKLIQWFEYTGVFGGTAWILGANLLIWNLLRWIEELSSKRVIIGLIIILLFISFPITVSLLKYNHYSEKSDPVDIVIAQPNIDPYHDKFGGMDNMEQLRRLLNVSDSLGNNSTQFFIGPETALHEVWENNPQKDPQITAINKFITEKYPNACFVTGASSFLRYLPGEKVSSTARHSADGKIIYDAYNAACFISKDNPVGFYHKTKLVSGVEKMPFEKYLHFLEKLVINLGGISGTLGTQKDTVVFNHEKVRVAVPICYESGYGEYLTGFVKKGANILFVITNDGWWKDTPGYKQHLSYSRLRAVELRRSIARSANTGISCFINQRGDIEKQSSWWTLTSISGRLNLNEKITFYARHGDYIAKLSVIVFGLLSISFFLSIITKRKK
jgi:apolipoprotein N-acyltransferase